jgi:hypothetical protein
MTGYLTQDNIISPDSNKLNCVDQHSNTKKLEKIFIVLRYLFLCINKIFMNYITERDTIVHTALAFERYKSFT